MIETDFDVPFVARMALREKQIQQSYRPIIAVHKWFARRPGTLFRGLLLSEFGSEPVAEAFCKSNHLDGRKVADPFMGGGSPLIEANRLGCHVTGYDINPMSYWIVRQEIEHLDLASYRKEATQLINAVQEEVGGLYTTNCIHCSSVASVKYFLWVKQHCCPSCGSSLDLWPGYLLAKKVRHPANVVVCHRCGCLNEVSHLDKPGKCSGCLEQLKIEGTAIRNRITCHHCKMKSKYPLGESPPSHQLFAIEYHCVKCRPNHRGRFFKVPDKDNLRKVAEAEGRLRQTKTRFVPTEEILQGDETKRLFRWGYQKYRDLFNARQLLGLEISCRKIVAVKDQRVRNALATNLSDLLRYQNMLCRYDTMALKSLDIFSIHSFPVSLVECESNLLGIASGGAGNVGSGGWSNIVAKYAKAKRYCDRPFETITNGTKRRVVYPEGEWIGDRRNGKVERETTICCADSATVAIKPEVFDAILTDPPYFGNVQYAELMDFCYLWLRKLLGNKEPGFDKLSTRNKRELTGNTTGGRGLEHFTHGLSKVFRSMAAALKPGGPLAFTYHHNVLSVYSAVGVAILDARLPCTATFPCPAEMGGSIHIAGTESSIVDTVFVCRKNAAPPPVPKDPTATIVQVLVRDVEDLAKADYKATKGDITCLLFGHLTCLTINGLWDGWEPDLPEADKLTRFETAVSGLAVVDDVRTAVEAALGSKTPQGKKQVAFHFV